jgi:hypothetical protein
MSYVTQGWQGLVLYSLVVLAPRGTKAGGLGQQTMPESIISPSRGLRILLLESSDLRILHQTEQDVIHITKKKKKQFFYKSLCIGGKFPQGFFILLVKFSPSRGLRICYWNPLISESCIRPNKMLSTLQ